MKSSRNVFTPEFKQECIKLVIEQVYDVAQAASGMNVGKSSLQKWISQYRQERQGITPKSSAITPEKLRI
jgi:transposase